MRWGTCLLALVALGALVIAPADARHRRHVHAHAQKNDKTDASPKGRTAENAKTVDAWVDTHAKRPKLHQKAKRNGADPRVATGAGSRRHKPFEGGRNAIGAALNQDKPDAQRNALGLSVTTPGPTPDAKTIFVPPGGATPPDPRTVHPSNRTPVNAVVNRGPGFMPGMPNTAPSTGAINGTTMIRPAFRAGGIGGAPRVTAGVIGGNSISRHP